MTRSLDQGRITIGGTSTDYDLEVERICNDMILTSVTGKAIAFKIKAHGTVLITDDYPGFDSREVNSDFEPGRGSKKLAVVGFHRHNYHLNTVEVVYNGNPITLGQLNLIHQHSPGMKPDEILCHELVHAARYLGSVAPAK
jgi:hypothetical protein